MQTDLTKEFHFEDFHLKLTLGDGDGDGIAEYRETFATELDRPFGLVFSEGFLYVANNNAVVRCPYARGQVRAQGAPEHIVDLPVSSDALDHDTAERLGIDISRTRGFNHWTRNLIFGPDGNKTVSYTHLTLPTICSV